MWNLFECSAQGRSHKKYGIPCQDKTCVKDCNGTFVVALADGAGSASLSHYGAECVTNRIADELVANFDSYWNEENIGMARFRFFQEIDDEIQKTSETYQCEKKDLASTLLTVAVKDDKYLIYHIGDGVIGYWNGTDIKVASQPTNGEFSNTTIFTTSKDSEKQAKLLKGKLNDIRGFILMSDGPEACLYNHREKKLISGLHEIFQDASTNDPEIVSANLQETIDCTIINKTNDDCSIALMVLQENTHVEVPVEEPAEESYVEEVQDAFSESTTSPGKHGFGENKEAAEFTSGKCAKKKGQPYVLLCIGVLLFFVILLVCLTC